jgi:hypothetical protein
MTAVLGALWTFANSPAGLALVTILVGKLFHSAVKSTSRQAQILGYADSAFLVLEALGPQLGLKGTEKYTKFIEMIVNSLKAANLPELSGPEMAMLKDLATRKALLTKTPATIH